MCLKDFSMKLASNENLVILGKSRIWKILFWIKVVSSSFNGAWFRWNHRADHDIKRVGIRMKWIYLGRTSDFLFQSNALYDSMTIAEENLEFPLRRPLDFRTTWKPGRGAVMEVIGRCGDFLIPCNMMPSELSGRYEKTHALAKDPLMLSEGDFIAMNPQQAWIANHC